MKAIIAMSGGVDSSVAACLMKKRGFDCIGATLKLHSKDNDILLDNEQSCCSSKDIEDAKFVSQKLNIPFYVYDFQGDFKEKVIDNFVSVYENGGTPNPCIECNRHLKFKKLFEKMKELHYDYVVTGHYARIEEKDGWFYLKKGLDETKDQSYVLYSLTQEQLGHILFPLGEYSKTEIRSIAEEQGLHIADKKDSQDICFVSDGDYAGFIEKYTGKKYPKGNFVDVDGNVIGTHQGIIRYTNGQRKGLGVAFGKPMYVAGKDVEKNTVTLCTNEQLFTSELFADDFNWLIPHPQDEMKCKARIRYNMKEQEATVFIVNKDKVKVVFDKPQRAITKGQALVLYEGDTVLGGGTII